MLNKTKILFITAILLMSILPMKSMKVMAAFNEASAYQEGKYKSTAEHPLAFSWSRNSQNTSVDAEKVEEFFKPDYGMVTTGESLPGTEYISTNPVVDEDGTIYISTFNSNKDNSTSKPTYVIYALDKEGNVKWTKKLDRKVKGMVIYSNGNLIYNDNTLNMIDSKTGKDVWQKPINIGSRYTEGQSEELFKGSPVIDKDGNVIVAHNNGLYAFNKDGVQVAFLSKHLTDGEVKQGVSIRSDGTIFFSPSTFYSYKLENGDFVQKYDPYYGGKGVSSDKITLSNNGDVIVGDIKRIFNPETKETVDVVSEGTTKGYVSPTVYNKDGSIYWPLSSGGYYDDTHLLNKYNSDGELIWSYNSTGRVINSPVIDGKGNVLFVERISPKEYYFTSLKENKVPNWSVLLPDKVITDEHTYFLDNLTPVVIKDGSILLKTQKEIIKIQGAKPTDSEEETTEPTEESKTNLVTVFNESDKYDEPSFESQAAYTVYEYTEKKDDWYKVITAPGHTKWINAFSVLEGEFETKEASITLKRDSIGYSSPFFYAKKTGDVLKKDKEVQVNGHIGDWYLTKVDGHNIWFNQDESKLTTFVYNKIYTEPDFSKPSPNGGVGAQTLNVKDLIVKDNGEVWYKIQSWVGDVYTPALEGDLEAIKEVNLTISADKLNAFETPFKETSSKTYNEEKVTLIAKWQNWYKTSDNLWVKFN